MKLFDASVYAARRANLMAALGKGVALFPGSVEQAFNYKSNTYPFRQDSSFLYYFGFSQPGLSGIIDADSGKSILVGNDADIEDVVWMGPQPAMRDRIKQIGADEFIPAESLHGYMHGKSIHYLPPYHADRIFYLAELLNKSTEEIKSGHSMELVRAVIKQRSHKAPEEIDQMEQALYITAAIHTQIRKSVAPGKYEAQIRGIAEGVAFANQARLAYQAICTIQGQTLHNNDYHRLLKEGDMLLCDIGAENIMGYAGDITRSYPVSPTFSSMQAEIYDLVLKAEMKSIEAVKAGVRYLDIHLGAARIIAEGLKQIGLMKGDVDEAVAAGAHALFFPHGLGHMIGLDVHDLENLGENYVGYDDTVQRSQQFGTAYLRMARALEPGFVITVEPGIYFIPELIDMWQDEGKFKDFICYDKLDPYRNFTGIRIEDNVLVTTDGPVILGPPIPKMRSDIER
ncbi:MAG: aminopeptidase P family protein [Saprospiraceae bacterium]|nr:aminopeptidase P family protein [Candidatus Opimibacter skivensis]MBL0006678.1 aminopeptidase P family protein [Candidatus Opimibacter skivensis]